MYSGSGSDDFGSTDGDSHDGSSAHQSDSFRIEPSALIQKKRSESIGYGFYLEFEHVDDKDPSAIPIVIHTPNRGTSVRSPRRNPFDNNTDPEICGDDANHDKVLCEVVDEKAPIVYRSFEDRRNGAQTRVVSATVEGFRIVQDEFQEFAEYKVLLEIGQTIYVSWKRFSDFEELANACKMYVSIATLGTDRLDDRSLRSDRVGLGGYFKQNFFGFFSPTEIPTFDLRHSNHFDMLPNTLLAWELVMQNRPWFSSAVSMKYLNLECRSLFQFLRAFLFEVPSEQVILEFMH